MAAKDPTLAQRLRQESKKIHDRSNVLVNARLVGLFTDRVLYGEALYRFYLIFNSLERCLEEGADDPVLAALLPTARPLYRAEAIQQDLDFYLG
jgi:heme oxygenase